MSDEHGWPDLSDPHGHDDHGDQQDAGVHQEPPPGADDALHDHLYGHDDPDPDGFDPDDPYAADAHAADDPGSDDPDGSDPDAHDVADAGGNEPGTGHDDPGVDVTDGHGMGPVGADPDAAPDAHEVSMFPPVVDVGPLPEPVDGFPWIDTGSLGLYHAGPVDPATAQPTLSDPVAAQPVPAEDLAAYAAEDLPPGVDPWAALADSDDPATGALAEWWRPR
jgi:hypothetical protein